MVAAMEDERRFFSAEAAEGLLKGPLRQRLPASARTKLKEAGLDLDGPLPRGVPAARWRKFVDIVAEELDPDASKAEGHRRVAKLLLDAYGQTMLGKAFLVLAKVLGPKQVVDRVHDRLRRRRSRNAHLTKHGDADFELWVREPAVSNAFTEALLQSALERLGATGVEVKHLRRKEEGCFYRVTWDV